MRSSTAARSGFRQVDPAAIGWPPGRKSSAEASQGASQSWAAATERANALSTTKPSRAMRIAGSTRSRQGSEPNRWCAAQSPATEPGTPDARCPASEPFVTAPAESTYMSRDAPPGAFSRKSSVPTVPSAMWATMKPPPPMLPASG